MPCIERDGLRRLTLQVSGVLTALALALAAACTRPLPPPPAPAPAEVPASAPASTPASAPASAPQPASAEPPPQAARYVQLAAPVTPRNAAELRLQFARRLVAAHPDTSYTERAPDRLWAIPVLAVELNANGSVRHITVLRKPSTGHEATALAIAAVHRAAPFGDVSRLPKPWQVVETFLFDDDLRFKPRTLDIE